MRDTEVVLHVLAVKAIYMNDTLVVFEKTEKGISFLLPAELHAKSDISIRVER